MSLESEWENHFAWLPIKIDGIRYWLTMVQRRRVVMGEQLEPFAAPSATAFWQYRVRS